MIKKLLLSLCIVMGAQAHVPAFPLEAELTRLYFDVDIDANRIYMQKLAAEYVAWCSMVSDCIETKQDTMYITRIAHMFGEVIISYEYGN